MMRKVDIINDDMTDFDNIIDGNNEKNKKYIANDNIEKIKNKMNVNINADIDGLIFEDHVNSINEKIILVDKTLKEIKNIMGKMISAYNKDIKTVIKNKPYKKQFKRKNTGFMKENKIPDKISKFLKLNDNTKMTRNDIVKKVYAEIKDRNLVYDKDGRVFRVDDDLSKTFNIPLTVNDSISARDKNGFNFYNLQHYVAKVYKNDKIDDKKIKKNKKNKK